MHTKKIHPDFSLMYPAEEKQGFIIFGLRQGKL
jgi:hypothetical protein